MRDDPIGFPLAHYMVVIMSMLMVYKQLPHAVQITDYTKYFLGCVQTLSSYILEAWSLFMCCKKCFASSMMVIICTSHWWHDTLQISRRQQYSLMKRRKMTLSIMYLLIYILMKITRSCVMIVPCIYHVNIVIFRSLHMLQYLCFVEKEVDSLMEELLRTVRKTGCVISCDNHMITVWWRWSFGVNNRYGLCDGARRCPCDITDLSVDTRSKCYSV